MRLLRVFSPLLATSAVLSCAGSAANTARDAAVDVADADVADVADAAPDASTMCDGEATPRPSFAVNALFVAVGQQRVVTLRLERDRCSPYAAPITFDDATVARPGDATARIAPRESSVDITLTGLRVGRTTAHVGAATLTVDVRDDAVPACPTATAPASGRLAAGSAVRGAAGTPLAAASVAMPAAATEIAAITAQLRCAASQVPDGYTAIGPAVQFDPGLTTLLREIPFTVPINPSKVPVGYELQVELAYSGPAFQRPRIVPVADVRFTDDGNALQFAAPRFGTWQAVVRSNLGAQRIRRRFTYHGILGVSMGAAGASMIGMRHLDRFDFLAPLGGPTDWSYLGWNIRNYQIAGFCTAAERARDPEGCARGSSEDRTPPLFDLYQVKQHFEHFYYPDGRDGQGGNFDRRSYLNLMKDLTRGFGNGIMPSGPTGILPRGVPDGELARTEEDRCAHPVTLTGLYDREFNPDGSLPVITFCDGTHTADHIGEWDGAVGDYPLEVSLAVDVNRNGRRDRGEPVLRQFYEPFRDVGPDGVASRDEPGYDAQRNPDPAGDDYDRQFNPSGLEGNFVHDDAEPYDDVGVDGVACPAGRTCPYDLGEGNHRWDVDSGGQRFLDIDPRRIAARAPLADLSRVEVWTDGGVHDLFSFAVVSNHFVGGLSQRGFPMHYFNNFASLTMGRSSEVPFRWDLVDWAHVPSHVMLRYGNPDASPAELMAGDGGHVGTINQVTSRFFAATLWMASRWPGGDRSPILMETTPDNAGRCAHGYTCSFDFHSDRANSTRPVSIFLPPGYHDPENAGVRYPVVFLLHGYGQSADSLLPTGLLITGLMANNTIPSWRRPQKFIMVFPDGRCRDGDRCFRGTFYADSPVGSAQVESYFLDLYDFVDRTYRVRQPEEVEVVR